MAMDYLRYYKEIINEGRTELKTPEIAEEILVDLKDLLPAEIELARHNISGYLTIDHIEGLIPFYQENADSEVHNALERVFYMQAILLKFPELETAVSPETIAGLIGIWEKCNVVADSIKENDKNSQYTAQDKLSYLLAEAQTVAKRL